MRWVAVMALSDGSRVESSMPTIGETSAHLNGHSYRVRAPDGTTTVFATLTLVLDHVRESEEAGDRWLGRPRGPRRVTGTPGGPGDRARSRPP